MKLYTTLLAAGLLATSFAVQAAPHWEYEGHGGTEHWGDLDPAFKTCKAGKEQSPIDIHSAKKSTDLKPITFNYTAGPAEIVNNGHTIQVNLANGGSIKLGNDEYKLLQFHFHTPSEELINGKSFPLVAHLVHKSAEGKLAVVAVLFNLGEENVVLRDIFRGMPEQANASVQLGASFDASQLLPKDQAYYAFKGSLTTPPCSEGVRWQVLKNTQTISNEQFAAFKGLYPLNARPVQPLHGRKVQSSN
jgi:carbonic anhydrase